MSREHAIPRTHLFLETSSLWVGVEAVKRKVITAYLLNLRRRFEPAGLNRQIREINCFVFHQMIQRKRRMETSKDTFATFWNEKETGAEMCPAIASGIVTEDALVSYWPMLLAIIAICTRAQLHSKTISGFACVASVSVRFLSRESKTARPLHSLSYDLYSVLGQPKSIKKFFPGYYIQSWRKFKLFSRKKGIQGLFKTFLF